VQRVFLSSRYLINQILEFQLSCCDVFNTLSMARSAIKSCLHQASDLTDNSNTANVIPISSFIQGQFGENVIFKD